MGQRKPTLLDYFRPNPAACICGAEFDRQCPVNVTLMDRYRGPVQGLFSVAQKHGITTEEVREHLTRLPPARVNYEA